MVWFVILTLLCISSYANAIRCWQCAFVDGRKCPRDAKVTMIFVFDYGLNSNSMICFSVFLFKRAYDKYLLRNMHLFLKGFATYYSKLHDVQLNPKSSYQI